MRSGSKAPIWRLVVLYDLRPIKVYGGMMVAVAAQAFYKDTNVVRGRFHLVHGR